MAARESVVCTLAQAYFVCFLGVAITVIKETVSSSLGSFYVQQKKEALIVSISFLFTGVNSIVSDTE